MRGDTYTSIYDPNLFNNWEYIEWRLLADNDWNLRLNTDWYWCNWLAAWFSWIVYVDWEYSWRYVWYSTPNLWYLVWSYITIWTWLTPNSVHHVRIVPTREAYWWARALSSPFDRLVEVVYNTTYKWYGKNATHTWDYFKYGQYFWCTMFSETLDNNIPDTVTTWWNHYLWYQYWDCVNLETVRLDSNWFTIDSTQFSWAGNFNKPMVVYADSDSVIPVLNSAWLVNDNVYRIIVDSTLIDSYKSNFWWSEIESWKFRDVLDDYLVIDELWDDLIYEDNSEEDSIVEMELSNKYLNTEMWHKISFLNDDWSYISTIYVEHLDMPVYNWDDPYKKPTVSTVFTFTWWDNPIGYAVQDCSYTAVYSSSTRYYTITFEDENWNILQQTQETYWSTPTPPQAPTKDWYMFKWRWDWVKPVTCDATYTAQYMASVYYNTNLWLISITNDWENRVTLSDKNIWASQVWNYWDEVTESNRGYYYQWWNNYWFRWDLKWYYTVDASWYSPSTFGDNIFHACWNYDWSSTNNPDLRWDTTDTLEARKWPCATWYHIPSNSEWIALWTALWSLWVSDYRDVINYLKLAATWRINQSTVVTNDVYSYWYYRSSTPDTADTAKCVKITSNTLGSFIADQSAYRSMWASIRAFKNTPVVPDNTWTQYVWTSISTGWIYWNADDWLVSISSDWSNWITIKDKNEWATELCLYLEYFDQTQWWNFYQRWNNYWFKYWYPHGSVSYDNAIAQISKNVSSYAPSWYSSSDFDESLVWISPSCPDIWWDITNTNEARKWPCPTWYHIPSKGEFENVISILQWQNLEKVLKLPRTWWMFTWSVTEVGGFWRYWTSTQIVWDYYSYNLYPEISRVNAWYEWIWYPIRPMKNTPVVPDNTWTTL